MHSPWLPKHLCEVGRCTIGGPITYPQPWLRTQSWIRPGQFLLSRSLVSCILIRQMGKWNKKDFFQVIQLEHGKAGPINNILWLPFQINCAAYTSYWSSKTENDWQAWFMTHDTASNLNNVLQYMRFVSSVIIAYHWR